MVKKGRRIPIPQSMQTASWFRDAELRRSACSPDPDMSPNMNLGNYKQLVALTFALAFLSVGIANAQIQAAGGGYYVAGYGRVYGSFGQASLAQSRMYDAVKSQSRKTTERDALVQKWGLAAVEKAERDAASGSPRSSNPKIVVPPPPVVRNHGVFRPDPTIDTGNALGDALGNSPEEKALIKQIFASTKTAYEKEAASRGWKNNIAAGLTFFTVSAMTAYHDAEEPSDEALTAYYKIMNLALDEIPELGAAANKDKQGFNNMLVGFGGLVFATYSEAKQNNDANALATSKKLAGMLIEMVLKTDPDNLRIENGQIVMK
jgi:hypothetical protein